MLTSGDVVIVDLGLPAGREAGYPRPVIVVTTQRILDEGPSVVQVVPVSSTIRSWESEVVIEPDHLNGLSERSAAQCRHIRSISVGRLGHPRGNIGGTALLQVREVLGLILGIGS